MSNVYIHKPKVFADRNTAQTIGNTLMDSTTDIMESTTALMGGFTGQGITKGISMSIFKPKGKM